MNPWRQRAKRRVLIRKSQVRKAAKPYALAVEGSRAYREGKTVAECPYPADSARYKCWLTGWTLAREKEQDRG